MKLLKLVAVEAVEVGDTFILGAHRYMVSSIEDEPTGRDFRLKDIDGVGKCQFVAAGEKVAIEL